MSEPRRAEEEPVSLLSNLRLHNLRPLAATIAHPLSSTGKGIECEQLVQRFGVPQVQEAVAMEMETKKQARSHTRTY
eukprot:9476141-Pyramimonas_sp.AAC.2